MGNILQSAEDFALRKRTLDDYAFSLSPEQTEKRTEFNYLLELCNSLLPKRLVAEMIGCGGTQPMALYRLGNEWLFWIYNPFTSKATYNWDMEEVYKIIYGSTHDSR